MSGGVDSSVAAALLKKQGFGVVGIFMKFWKDGKTAKNSCCTVESEKMARLVTKKLGIPFYVINAEKEFKKKVVDYFLHEYKKGNTPNPCVVCNKEIKFGLLIEKALKMGADYVATGHYARLRRETQNPKLEIRNSKFETKRAYTKFYDRGNLCMLKSKDENKDQSYFLWQLNQKQLSRVLFPVENYTKPEVRSLAKKFDLPSAQTPESQEVCFVPGTTADFLKKYLKIKPGPVIEQAQNGVKNIIGQHNGLWFYTIGQRKGIEVQQGPWYVVAKDFKNNNLIVSKNKKDLLQKELIAKNVNWISGKEPKLPIKVQAKIRYRHPVAKTTIYRLQLPKGRHGYKLVFAVRQKAVTPGQSVVFYRGAELLGGAIIDN